MQVIVPSRFSFQRFTSNKNSANDTISQGKMKLHNPRLPSLVSGRHYVIIACVTLFVLLFIIAPSFSSVTSLSGGNNVSIVSILSNYSTITMKLFDSLADHQVTLLQNDHVLICSLLFLQNLRLDRLSNTFRFSVIADLDQGNIVKGPKGDQWSSIYMTVCLMFIIRFLSLFALIHLPTCRQHYIAMAISSQ